MDSDEYRTVSGEYCHETKVHGSRFIATVMPSSTKSEAEEFIGRLKNHFHDATHNCYAYRCGTDANQFRVNDDGEPGGTAGKPILAAIDKRGLTDVVVVVTRYFGGTKLGVGGLIRAYGDAAEKVLSSSTIVTRYLYDVIHVAFPHAYIGAVMHVASMCNAKIADTQYDEEVHLTMEVRRSKCEELRTLLLNNTNGNIRFKPEGQSTES